MSMKTCTKCKRELPLDAFYKSSQARGGLQGRCKNCIREYQQDPDRKAIKRVQDQRPSVRAKVRARNQSPEGKAYRRSPDRKNFDLKYRQRPDRRVANRAWRLMDSFGITPEQWQRMFDSQGGCCGICGTDKPGGMRGIFNTDHCHVEGWVRGLLCHNCNCSTPLELEIIFSAVDYLKNPPAYKIIGMVRAAKYERAVA